MWRAISSRRAVPAAACHEIPTACAGIRTSGRAVCIVKIRGPESMCHFMANYANRGNIWVKKLRRTRIYVDPFSVLYNSRGGIPFMRPNRVITTTGFLSPTCKNEVESVHVTIVITIIISKINIRFGCHLLREPGSKNPAIWIRSAGACIIRFAVWSGVNST
jgi:hypothetical protein